MPRRHRNAGERPQLPPLPRIDRTQRIPPLSPGARIAPSMTGHERQADA
jgi:hypothetical protein